VSFALIRSGAVLAPDTAMEPETMGGIEWGFELVGLGLIALCLCVFVFSSRIPPVDRYRDVR